MSVNGEHNHDSDRNWLEPLFGFSIAPLEIISFLGKYSNCEGL